MVQHSNSHKSLPGLGLDMGVFAIKGVLVDDDRVKKYSLPASGQPVEAAQKCLNYLLEGYHGQEIRFGLVGHNARLIAESLGVKPMLEIQSLQLGLSFMHLKTDAALSLGHENMHYLELDEDGTVSFFNRNGQCAAGSGAFWYQQATRMGYDDKELAEVALEADNAVPISGRCAVFAKSDMTHAINEGATQNSVSAGMAKALVDTVITSVTQNRLQGPARMVTIGGVAENKAVMKHLNDFARDKSVEIEIPEDHQYLNALGAAQNKEVISTTKLKYNLPVNSTFKPEHPLPPLDQSKVHYLKHKEIENIDDYDLSIVYMGVDCGSVSTKCMLLDNTGEIIGGVYLPTTGKPALQVLELMKKVHETYGHLLEKSRIVACTTGSGRFLSQKILNAEYAVDEITCQAEGVKYLFKEGETLSIIEIGGEDSKFLQIKDGVLYDYNMNPVCAAGTGTFLENLAELLGVKIEEEFSHRAFNAEYAMDLGDTCTLLSQSTLMAAASRGLPLESQLSSLAYSSARNYLSKTVENRPLSGKVVFTGATAKNQALASAFAAESGKDIYIPPQPELTGALGSALVARNFYQRGEPGTFSFRSLQELNSFQLDKKNCQAECRHEHNCTLNVIRFNDGSKFIYGDRCGRYSDWKKSGAPSEHPDYAGRREEIFYRAAGDTSSQGPSIGIARCGLYYDFFPFWSAFFCELGARTVVSSPTTEDTLERGKRWLDSEMCYPMKVLVGHYHELKEKDLDFIFVPEVINTGPLPWAKQWPRSFTCPLMQTISGTVINSLELKQDKVLYAQLNYREGREQIKRQLQPVAKKLLSEDFTEKQFLRAINAGYQAIEKYEREMEEESRMMMETLLENPDQVVAVFLSRPYTIYDDFVAKGSLRYARQKGLTAIPQDFFLAYLKGWYSGNFSSPILDPYREELNDYFQEMLEKMDNIYPAQLQRMVSTALLVRFLNERSSQTGLPLLQLVLQDPFKCGPNAMLRHYLSSLSGYLRLTLDEHTAAAGMITRLEAFKNTTLSRNGYQAPEFYSARTYSVKSREWDKILIPDLTLHAHTLAALFRNLGVDAQVLPQSPDKDLTLARRRVNGEECLPFIQNLQDFLEYLLHRPQEEENKNLVFFQGWACGPCRYGMYAPTQSLVLNKAGYGEGRICAIKYEEAIQRFGLGFGVGFFSSSLALDLLYKMLYSTRPYEINRGSAEELFNYYTDKLCRIMENFNFKPTQLPHGSYLKPLEKMLQEAAEDFCALPLRQELRPLILVGGEFYVRFDERCNQDIIRKIEEAGGEACLAPTSELLSYTLYIQLQEAIEAYRLNKSPGNLANKATKNMINWMVHRDEVRLARAANKMISGKEEPPPAEIMRNAKNYVPRHYGGEPPMTIGRTAAYAGRERVAGAVFVAPFTCMPGSVVEAQMSALQKELNIPIITVYYDGKEYANRDELVEGLVFQARQMLEHKPGLVGIQV